MNYQLIEDYIKNQKTKIVIKIDYHFYSPHLFIITQLGLSCLN